MSKAIVCYCIMSAAYGAVRKTSILRNAKIVKSKYDYEKREIVYNTKPLFAGSKLGVFVISTVYSPVLTPIWLCKDLDYIDAKLTGKEEMYDSSSDNDKPTFAFEYVFK